MDWITCGALFGSWTLIFLISDQFGARIAKYLSSKYKLKVDDKFAIQFPGYVVSTVHALLTTYRGFSHMYALKSNPVTAREPMALYSNDYFNDYVERVRDGVIITNQMVFTYMVHDLLHTLLRFPTLGGWDSVAHHVIFVAASFTAGWNYIFCYPFSWLVVGELSTPFLNIRWFLRAVGLKDSSYSNIVNLLFAITFAIARVYIFSSGLFEMLWDIKFVLTKIHPFGGVFYVVVNIVAAYFLNLFWFYKIVQAMTKVLFGKKHRKKKEKTDDDVDAPREISPTSPKVPRAE